MKRCDACNGIVFFRGYPKHGFQFCNEACYESRFLAAIANEIRDESRYIVDDLRHSICPECQGPGPLDVHTSYWVFSLIYYCQWSSKPKICCLRCGQNKKWMALLSSTFLGWWSIHGIFMTPWQIGQNIYGLCKPPDPSVPSEQLSEAIRLQLASKMAEDGYIPQSFQTH